jgi:DNA-binding transcriptional regulator YhcF (GntR family)
MLIRVDPDSAVGLAEQIAGQIRGQIASGDLRPGDRLPAARELAGGLEVNMHTVLRAYAALRDEGLLELRRGRGAQVASAAGELASAQAARLGEQIRSLVATAAAFGLTREQLLAEIRKVNP